MPASIDGPEAAQRPKKLGLNVDEASYVTGYCKRKLWELTKPRGPIPCIRVGEGKRQSVRYYLPDLETWMREQSAASKGGVA
jgi:hypothetical protein